MSDFTVLKEYYVRYLNEVRHTSDSTANHYLQALRAISKYLVEHGKLEESIYEVSELSELEVIRTYLYSQADFVEKDERGNRMYSAGLNNYIRFASGEEFTNATDVPVQMDIVVPLGDRSTVTLEQWHRNGIIKKQSIEMAHYSCEADQKHLTFVSKSTGHPYMEGHHAIPIKEQQHFNVSLDVYANIVCLCPICHRLLHYGVDNDKKIILNKVYQDRADRLANSGIKLSQEEFYNIAI